MQLLHTHVYTCTTRNGRIIFESYFFHHVHICLSTCIRVCTIIYNVYVHVCTCMYMYVHVCTCMYNMYVHGTVL